MGEFIVEDVEWKKGELGLQKFILFESDGITRRNGTGISYNFAFWKKGATTNKCSGALVPVDAPNGEYTYAVKVTDTDTIDEYIGELIEDPTGSKLKSDTFKVNVAESSDKT